MFIYISSAGYITKQPLFINVIGMFASIVTSTDISFFFIPIRHTTDSLVFHSSLHWERWFCPCDLLILVKK